MLDLLSSQGCPSDKKKIVIWLVKHELDEYGAYPCLNKKVYGGI
jgi:hypothetical protein